LVDAEVSLNLVKLSTGDHIQAIVRDITKRKQAENELKQTHAEIRQLFEHSMVGIFRTVPSGKVILVNPVILRILNYDSIDSMNEVGLANIYQDPSDRERLMELVKQGPVEGFETRVFRSDGRLIDILIKIYPVFGDDGQLRFLEGNLSDITERKRAEDALRNNEQLLRNVFESMQEGVLVLNSDFKYTYWNRSMEKISHSPREEVLGTMPWEKFPFLRGEIENAMKKAMKGEATLNAELKYDLLDGKIGWTRESYFPLMDLEKNISGVVGVIEEITEMKMAEKARDEAYTIVNSSPLVAFLWRNEEGWPVEFVTDNIKTLLGYYPDELLSGKIRYDQIVHPDDLDRVRQEVVTFSAEENRQEFVHEPYRVLTKKGKIRWVDDRTHIRRDEAGKITHYQGIILDITVRQQAKEALLESEEKYSSLFQDSIDGIIIHDVDGNIVDANQRILDLFGYSDSEFASIKLPSLHPHNALRKSKWAFETIAQQGFVRFEIEFRKKNGKVFPAEVSSSQFNIGKRRVIQGIVRDISERKRAEEELKKYRGHLEELVEERRRELKTAQEELVKRERLAVLGQLTATVSHELRNPLGVIRSSAFYLQRKLSDPDEKTLKHFLRIDSQINTCDAIISDLLEYTRSLPADKTMVEITRWLRQLLDVFCETANVKVIFQSALDLPPVSFDPEKMQRVVLNLLTNAVQAVAERKVQAQKKDDAYQVRIHVHTWREDDHVVIQVEDNGIGMDDEIRNRAFEPLFTTRAKGTGLGLAIVKKIVKEHNGSVSLESKLQEGTKIQILLPLSEF